MTMIKFSATLAAAVLVTACGGGSGGTSASGTAAPSPVNPTTAPLAAMPAVPANAVKFSVGASASQGASDQVMDLSFKAAVGLTISGQFNKVWVAAAAPGGNTTVTGSQNTIVFRPGTETAVNVSGGGNVFYLAEGSPIKIEGTGAAVSTVTYYKP
jgi:hypothetical protein